MKTTNLIKTSVRHYIPKEKFCPSQWCLIFLDIYLPRYNHQLHAEEAQQSSCLMNKTLSLSLSLYG